MLPSSHCSPGSIHLLPQIETTTGCEDEDGVEATDTLENADEETRVFEDWDAEDGTTEAKDDAWEEELTVDADDETEGVLEIFEETVDAGTTEDATGRGGEPTLALDWEAAEDTVAFDAGIDEAFADDD